MPANGASLTKPQRHKTMSYCSNTMVVRDKSRLLQYICYLAFIGMLNGIPVFSRGQELLHDPGIPVPVADTAAFTKAISYMYKWQGRVPDSCLLVLQEIIAKSRTAGFTRGIGGALAEMGNTYLVKGDFRQAEKYLRQSQEYPPFSEYVVTNTWNNLGSIYTSQGKYQEAIACFRKAINSRDQNVAVCALNNFIVLLLKLGRYDETLFYLEKQKAHARKWKQDWALAAALCNEGSIYLKRKDYAKLDAIASECLRLCKGPESNNTYFSMMTNIGSSYAARGNPGKALAYLRKIEPMAGKAEAEYRMEYYNELGAVLLKAGRPAEAIRRLQEGIALAGAIGITDILKPTADLAAAYYQAGDYRNAAGKYRLHLALKDSLHDVAATNSVHEYEVKFRTSEKDRELLEKKLVILKQQGLLRDKNIQIGIILTLLALLAIAGAAIYRTARHKRMLQDKAMEIMQQQARIKQLNAAIAGEERERKRLGRELHDGIGSMLSALNMNVAALQWKNRCVPEMNELDDIVKMVQDIGVEVRKSAHNLMPDYLLQEGLLHALQSLAAQVSTPGFSLQVSCYGAIDNLGLSCTLTLYRIIQELVNNVLKHAAARTAELQIRRHGNTLSITFEDDGIGFDTTLPADGIGLKQLYARLEAISGYITIDSAPGCGTTIYMEFNLNNTIQDNEYKHSYSG